MRKPVRSRSFFVVGTLLGILAAGRAGAVDPVRANALWVAESGGALKVATADGSLLLDLGDAGNVRAVAVDPGRSTVWLYSGGELRAYGFDGARKLALPLSLPETARSDLAVHPVDGSVWLAAGKDLRSVSAAGEAARSLRLSEDILALAVDPSPGLLWVATRKGAAAYDAVTGDPVRALALGSAPDVRDLDVDPLSGEVWIAHRDRVQRFSREGARLLDAAAAGLAAISAVSEVSRPGAGSGAWIATGKEARRIGAAGEILAAVEPFGGRGEIAEIVADPVDGSAWVTNAREIAQVGPAGQVLRSLTISPPVHVWDLAIFSEILPPEPPPGPPGPPDPAAVAPAVDPGVPTDIAAATAFLYTGSDPIQAGVTAGTIEPLRAAVIRGRVLDREGAPLAGAEVTVLGHPELGSTQSRRDGGYDLAVNGGGILVVQVAKEGYPAAQRQVAVPWRDYVWAEDVVLVRYDPAATVVISGGAEPQVARGSAVDDEDGSRRATLLFPAGTRAEMVLADGSVLPLPSLTVRATEYTVGERGPAAMPGPLPPSSGYTYAAELSVDEAVAAGAKKVVFSQPVSFYLENFLGFPVGGAVPVGYYDRDLAAWVPSDDGRIVRVLSVTAGLADLDVTGVGAPADAAALASLGITEAERRELAQLYAPGQSLWRVPIPHFTPWDCNWPFGPPDDAKAPKLEATIDERIEDPCEQAGSIIECQNQTLGEVVPVAGTSLSLHYRSDRVRGRLGARAAAIQLTGDRVPPGVKRVDLDIAIAGQRLLRSFSNAPGQTYAFVWDGRDGYGRPVQGGQPLAFRVGYVYDAVYKEPDAFLRSFSRPGASEITGSRERSEVTLWTTGSVALSAPVLGGLDALGLGLGGWTLSAHHTYDSGSRTLFRGDGGRRSREGVGRVATSWPLAPPLRAVTNGMDFDAAGNLYVALSHDAQVVKVDRAGNITRVAGSRFGVYGRGYWGDGGPATEAWLFHPQNVAVDREGNLYIADRHNYRIRKVDTQGVITTIAGTGRATFDGDNVPAVQASLHDPTDVAVDSQGQLFILDYGNHRIRKVGVDGMISTVAGTGSPGYNGDGIPGTAAQLAYPAGIGLDLDGNLLIADSGNFRVRRLGRDGTISTIAGNGTWQFSGDGGPATGAGVSPVAVAVDRNGTLLIGGGNRVRAVAQDGTISTLAGSGSFSAGGENVPPTSSGIDARYLAVAPSGALHVTPGGTFSIRKIDYGLPGFATTDVLLPAPDGREVYVFNSAGRHLRTVDSLTGVSLLEFSYDSLGRLASIRDRDGDTVRILPGATARELALVASTGQRTELRLNGQGFLESIENPAGERWSFTYSGEGLLSSLRKPSQALYAFRYDTLGRLVRDEDPRGGFKTLLRTETAQSHRVDLSTALERTFSYSVERLLSGVSRRTDTPAHGRPFASVELGGAVTTLLPDGTVETTTERPDPRFGMQAPVVQTDVRTPSGLLYERRRFRFALLAQPRDLLRVATFTESLEINRRRFLLVYEAEPRTFQLTTPENRQSWSVLDSLGRVQELRTADLEPIRFTRDAHGRVTAMVQGSGEEQRSLSLTYDGDGTVSGITDPLSRSLAYERDAAGRPLRRTVAGAGTLELSYDANGNIASLMPPGRPAHRFSYDAADLQEGYTAPAAGAEETRTRYVYNLDRQLERIQRPDGRQVGLSYDGAGRLSRLLSSSGATDYTYDPVTAKLAGIAAPGGETLSYTWDGFLPTGTTWAGPVAGRVEQTYDNNFHVVARSVNGANPVTFGYDRDGLLVRAGDLTLARHPGHGLLTGTAIGRVSTIQTYNGFGDLAGFEARLDASAVLSMAYTRDKLGRITRKVETVEGGSATYDYSYDPAGRLETVLRDGALLARYEYDANGNRTGFTGTGGPVTADHDVQDRLLRHGDRTYAWSANGELLTQSRNGHSIAYDYDELSNLRSVELPDGIRIDYVIDGRNRRVGKKVNGVLVQGFLYETPLKPAAELDGGGSVVARFVYGSRSEVPDYVVKGGAAYRIVADHLGSPRLVIDTATGEIAQRMDYDSFGNVILDTSPGFQPFGFAGGLYDRHTKLVRFGARDYDPAAGRWTTKDPAGFSGRDSNLYRYAFGDPVNLSDADGRQPGALAWGWGVALAEPTPVGEMIVGGISVGYALWALWEYFDVPDEEVEPAKPPSPGDSCRKPPPYPGNDPRSSPGAEWVWKGKGKPGEAPGSWHNPGTDESLYPDLDHKPPIGPHWDWKWKKEEWRLFPDGTALPKGK